MREPFASSTNGSFSGNFADPHSTECSVMWATPVLSSAGVRKAILKTLLSSVFFMVKMRAPLFV